jgi:hypothetical protein
VLEVENPENMWLMSGLTVFTVPLLLNLHAKISPSRSGSPENLCKQDCGKGLILEDRANRTSVVVLQPHPVAFTAGT